MKGFCLDFDSNEDTGIQLREKNSNTMDVDQEMDDEIARVAHFATQKTNQSDRFIPHRPVTKEFAQNYERKHIIFNEDALGSSTSPYEVGSNNRNQYLNGLIDSGFSDYSAQSGSS